MPFPRIPLATYRLQFGPALTFRQAAELADYLCDLGISDVYASPLFRATPHSSHGYDTCAFGEFAPTLGGRAGFDCFAARLKELGLGLLLDLVPNHMGTDSSNAWWMDVLEKGPASRFGSWFDIDWQAPDPELCGKVLLPVLEDRYAKVLEAGKLKLVSEPSGVALAYYERRFPLTFESSPELLNAPFEAHERFNGRPGQPRSFDQLDALLQHQHYRLAHWRVGPALINYRRFFEITDLVGLRMELREVFQATHALVFELLKEGKVTGLRADHPDGLWNPKQYLERVQAVWAGMVHLARSDTAVAQPERGCPSCSASGSEELLENSGSAAGLAAAAAGTAALRPGRANQPRDTAASGPLYVVVEKILSGDETLPSDWPVSGTTGYDFLNRVNGLFVNAANREDFDRIHREFSGDELGFEARVHAGKKQILHSSFVSELEALTRRLREIAASTRYGQALTPCQLRNALSEVIAAFPVYRTYITEDTAEVVERERRYIRQALAAARVVAADVRRRMLPPPGDVPPSDVSGYDFTEALAFIERLLLLDLPHDLEQSMREHAREFVMRFQQLTGPVMAKGVEDTALYNFNRLISLNEVGGNPDTFGTTPEQFHQQNSRQREQWPHSLLATATHDTKLGEDVRARINVLSEMPGEWQDAVMRWAKMNAGSKTRVAGHDAPAATDEYRFYQILVGAWPPEADRPAGLDAFRKRIVAYMLKAAREAKAHTNWSDPDSAYEAALQTFVEALLPDSAPGPFLEDFQQFQRRVAFFGRFNSLSQTLLKLTAPGVPDLYQGTELWDFNLVDPDNRRPVDFEIRRRWLADLRRVAPVSAAGMPEFLGRLLREGESGKVKLYLIWRALEFRRQHRELFQNGEYLPLAAVGERCAHVCAFARSWDQQEVIVIAPRLMVGLMEGAEQAPIGEQAWRDARVRGLKPDAKYRNVLTQELLPPIQEGGGPAMHEVLRIFPVALLERLSR